MHPESKLLFGSCPNIRNLYFLWGHSIASSFFFFFWRGYNSDDHRLATVHCIGQLKLLKLSPQYLVEAERRCVNQPKAEHGLTSFIHYLHLMSDFENCCLLHSSRLASRWPERSLCLWVRASELWQLDQKMGAGLQECLTGDVVFPAPKRSFFGVLLRALRNWCYHKERV